LGVIVSPEPATPLITYEDIALVSSTSEGYQWYLDGEPIPDANAQSHTPLVNGNYTVMTTDANGCSATSDPYFFGSTSIPVTPLQELHIFPQPVTDMLHVDGVANGSRYRLIDGQGRLVQEGSLSSSNPVIDLRASASGMYVLHVITPVGMHSGYRIIKQ
jgi:hypothetical protein